MKVNEAPKKVYLVIDPVWGSMSVNYNRNDTNNIEYTRTDTFIEKACEWIRENITNNPNANSVLVRNGCVTLEMLIEDFKKYMED